MREVVLRGCVTYHRDDRGHLLEEERPVGTGVIRSQR